jgi:hypothetical protein
MEIFAFFAFPFVILVFAKTLYSVSQELSEIRNKTPLTIMFIPMPKPFPQLLVLGVVLLSLVSVRCSNPELRESFKEPSPEHKALYQAKLQEYANVLKVGMNRKDVQSYLHSKGINFRQMCCVDEKDAFADLVLIGKEKPPFYCGEFNAYIAFQFAASEPRSKSMILSADSDVLTRITIYFWPENCV